MIIITEIHTKMAQSSVEYFNDKIRQILVPTRMSLTDEQWKAYDEAYKQAKAMHKEEQKMTAIKCHFEGTRQPSKNSLEYLGYAEQYYNENYADIKEKN